MKNQTQVPTDLKTALVNLDTFFDLYLVKKAPSLPENVKEIIVKYAPYLSIIGLIFSAWGLLMLLGFSALFAPAVLLSGARFGLNTLISIVFVLVTVVLEAMAISGLFSRKASAWKLLFYVALINAIYSLIRFDLGSLVIGTAVSLYFLYQVKSYYKN